MAEETLFDLPLVPDEFGVILPAPNLRRLDFSGLDYSTARRAIIEYIRTYYPNEFNDFVASNGVMMIAEIVAAAVAKLSLRADILANESTLPTAQTEEAIVNHLALINQRIRRQTPATTDVQCVVDQPAFTDIEIDAGTSFSFTGADGGTVTYEIYRAPNDWTSKIVVPAGKRGIIAWGVEGHFVAPVVATSPGGPNQRFTINQPQLRLTTNQSVAASEQILESPIFVSITVGNTTEDWTVITEPIERYGPTDKVVEVNFLEQTAVFRFGDDVTGKAPLSGSTIQFRFRVGGGIRGRIGVGQINTARQITPLPPANAPLTITFTNISPSNGGVDAETLDQAKRRAPRDFALQRSIVTAEDYAQAAISFNHPVFGSVSKALATIRTSLNANLVEIYVLAEGPDGLPTAPSSGLKIGLATFFSDLNVLTDHVSVLPGATHPVDIDMTVVINRNADASVVKERVESAITSFFALSNWEMGQAFYLSNFVEAIEIIDGIAYIDVLEPTNNILPTGQAAGTDPTGVGYNEIIVEGQRKTSYYYEKAPPPSGIRTGR